MNFHIPFYSSYERIHFNSSFNTKELYEWIKCAFLFSLSLSFDSFSTTSNEKKSNNERKKNEKYGKQFKVKDSNYLNLNSNAGNRLNF